MKTLNAKRPTVNAPTHVAIIMDGNGRWAKRQGLPRIAGHKKGAEALRQTLHTCRETGVSCLTVYAFSSENWKRPEPEVKDLMGLLKLYISNEIETLHKEKIRLRFIGCRKLLSPDVLEMVEKAEAKTQANQSFHLNIALSYGSQQEIMYAMRSIAAKVQAGELRAGDISEKTIADALYTSGLPDPDLLIRTGGEQRLSNFLLWQSAYTELYFTDTLWPDFQPEDFKQALASFATRERRYGNTE